MFAEIRSYWGPIWLTRFLALASLFAASVATSAAQSAPSRAELELFYTDARAAYSRWLWTADAGFDKASGGPWKAGEPLTASQDQAPLPSTPPACY